MLEEQIYKDYTDALRSRDKDKADFLSFIRAEIKNVAIDLKKRQLEDDEVLVVLTKQKKKLADSRDSMASSGRDDLIKKIDNEFMILEQYLPKALAQEELIGIINQVILDTKASSIKDMGKVMKEVAAKVGVRADPKKISQIVKDKLSLN